MSDPVCHARGMKNVISPELNEVETIAIDAAFELCTRGTNRPRMTRILKESLERAQQAGFGGEIAAWASVVMNRSMILTKLTVPQGRKRRLLRESGDGTAFAA